MYDSIAANAGTTPFFDYARRRLADATAALILALPGLSHLQADVEAARDRALRRLNLI